MEYSKHYYRLKKFEKLIQQQKTGTPQEIANYLNVSERTVHRMISDLCEVDKREISWCRKRKTYFFREKSN